MSRTTITVKFSAQVRIFEMKKLMLLSFANIANNEYISYMSKFVP